MSSDVLSLVRRDHDDLDHMLQLLADPETPGREAQRLCEAVQLSFAAHSLAESAALQGVLGPDPTPRVLALIVRTILDEHKAQARALAALALAGPGTASCMVRALKLREQLLDHAAREEFMRVSLHDHVPTEMQQALACRYEAERLAQLSPPIPTPLFSFS